MNVQVITRDGEAEYAVLPWAEYQALLAAAGRPVASVAVETTAPAVPSASLLERREARGLSLEQVAPGGRYQSFLHGDDRTRRTRGQRGHPVRPGACAGQSDGGLTLSVLISRKHWDSLLLEIEDARRQRHLLTYRALIERLQLPTPAMTTLTAALEHLASLDARSGRPLRSSLVISQGASRLPRTGFFECVERLGRFSGPPDGPAAAGWHAAEVVRVFEFEYPDEL
ncbi:putative transcriptional regulator [Pseudomonas aeruginosa]|nr:putative transcriptional regulator [Pseudomonas aeruginosa]